MKLLVLLLLCASSLRAQVNDPKPPAKDSPPGKTQTAAFPKGADVTVKAGPKPIPPDRFEEISRAMLKAQISRNRVLEAAMQSEVDNRSWQAIVEREQKAAGADPRCEITFDKQWNCPPDPPPAVDAKANPAPTSGSTTQ